MFELVNVPSTFPFSSASVRFYLQIGRCNCINLLSDLVPKADVSELIKNLFKQHIHYALVKHEFGNSKCIH